MSSPCQKTLVGLALASALATGCEPPPVVPTAERRQSQRLSRIEGQVVVQSRARGNAIVLLYDADRPPPPQGTGRPLTFTVIPAEQLFGRALEDPGASGPFTAPFTFSLVAPGRYLLRGFIDADTCRAGAQPCHRPDFIPWYGVTGEPNKGDVGGASVDALTRAPRLVEVAAGPDGVLQAPTGVTVSFSDSSAMPEDRPAFLVLGESRFDPAAGPMRLELRPLQLREGVMDVWPSSFLVRYVDDNGDGLPDDANGDSQPDLWPRVVVHKLAEGQEPAVPSLLAEEPPVVLAATIAPDTALLDALRKPDGTPRMEAVPVPSLGVLVLPRALDARDPRRPVPLPSVPRGRYALTLLQFTGQTWRVPNELAPALAPARGLPSVESQSFILQVP